MSLYPKDRIDEHDASGKLGARRIANRIITYWRGCGYRGITADVIETTMRDHFNNPQIVYRVISNIGPRGYPPLSPA